LSSSYPVRDLTERVNGFFLWIIETVIQ